MKTKLEDEREVNNFNDNKYILIQWLKSFWWCVGNNIELMYKLLESEKNEKKIHGK